MAVGRSPSGYPPCAGAHEFLVGQTYASVASIDCSAACSECFAKDDRNSSLVFGEFKASAENTLGSALHSFSSTRCGRQRMIGQVHADGLAHAFTATPMLGFCQGIHPEPRRYIQLKRM